MPRALRQNDLAHQPSIDFLHVGYVHFLRAAQPPFVLRKRRTAPNQTKGQQDGYRVFPMLHGCSFLPCSLRSGKRKRYRALLIFPAVEMTLNQKRRFHHAVVFLERRFSQ